MKECFFEAKKSLKECENIKPSKALIFMVYPPTDLHPYYHYKNCFKAWSVYNTSSKIVLLISLIALVVSIIAFKKI